MNRAAILLASVLVLSACSRAEDAALEEPAARSTSAAPTGTVAEPAQEPEVDPNPEEEQAVADAATQDTIPARFHGKWADKAEACAIRGHQQYRIGADEVGFFESRGIVQSVRVDGDYAAATLSEQYGDAPPAVYVFYMAREGDDAMRLATTRTTGSVWCAAPRSSPQDCAARLARLRSCGSRMALRRRMFSGVTSTISSSSI